MLYGILEISIDLFGCQCAGGDERARTADPLLAKQVLSQLSYIPWDTGAIHRAYSDASPASSSACEDRLRGRLSDLESLKSGKDRTKNLGPCLLGLLMHSNERNATDFHRELSRLPRHLSITSSCAFGTTNLRNSKIATLRRPNNARYCRKL